jgi:hypothetical protein
MLRRQFLLAATGAVATVATAGFASVAEAAWTWHFLGRRRVNFVADHDKIAVGGNRMYKKIMIKATGNGVFVHRMRVVYGNGADDIIPVKFHFKKGQHSRVIDLRGNKRHIRSVHFFYSKPLNFKGASFVNLYGRT